ncbi:MAG: O-antigen ligase family protein [Burkholderiales bacterium]
MISIIKQHSRTLYLTCLFVMAPLWNIPHTIAVRYFFAFFLLIILFFSGLDWRLFFRGNKILLGLFCYLVVHLIFFTTDFPAALNNFLSEWMILIVFSILGAGTGLLLARDGPKRMLLFLGIAFTVPLLIHLGASLYEGLKRMSIPWGYWGINEMHGDLGYTAIHGTIFLSMFLLFQAKEFKEKATALCLLLTCLASPLLASSRGGTIFVLIILMVVALIDLAFKFQHELTLKKQIIGLVAILVVSSLVIKIGTEVDPVRWKGALSRLQMGLMGDPIQITCKGTGVVKKQLEDAGVVIAPEILRLLDSIQNGDGGRVVTARAALALAGANPWGINQSKQAYEIALSQVCNPVIRISPAHNGWLDTALAIGIPGAMLYFLVLLNFAKSGYRSMRLDAVNRPYSVALFTMSSIWIVRAFFDSTQRDQMLEMQIFTIALLSGFIASREQPRRETLDLNSIGPIEQISK